ncbi:MAG TPA: exodeoxyribonuclease III [Polyangiales bacterium]
MMVASWNVNSINARRERLLRWLADKQPDVLCLQELKGVDEGFPSSDVYELGYHSAIYGQRTYNGVAILAKSPLEDVRRGFDDGVADAEARFLSARVNDVRVLCCYVPNGQEISSDKYSYKLRWLDRLLAYLERHHTPAEPLVLCGDFNIAPEDIDVYAPDAWRESVLFHAAVREKWRLLLQWGLVDTFRKHVSDPGKYSWWDYRMLSFPKGRGLRIDHVLATAPLAARCSAAAIDREERKGKQPSDHAPVSAVFA